MHKIIARTWFPLFALAVVLALVPSCATNSQALGPKFREANAANLVIRYSSDSTIYRLKPDAHDGAFYRIYNRQQLCEEAARQQGDRNLAVVVINYIRFPELERQVKQGWVDNLSELNFRRVVFLRADNSDEVDGLRVVEDRLIAQNALRFQSFAASSTAPQLSGR